MKSVTVLICVFIKKTRFHLQPELSDLQESSVVSSGSLATLNTQSAFSVVSKIGRGVNSGVVRRIGTKLCPSEEPAAFDTHEESLLEDLVFTTAVACLFLYLLYLMFPMVDVEKRQGQRSSLVQVVFVARAKVTPETRTYQVSSNGMIVKDDQLAGRKERKKQAVNTSSGAFGFRAGFLTKKRRPNPAPRLSNGPAKRSSLLKSIDLKVAPKLIDQGNVSVVYSLFNSNGDSAGIFKPYERCDAFENHLAADETDREKFLLNTKAQAMNEIGAYQFDQRISDAAKAGVPETQHVKLPTGFFDHSDGSVADTKTGLQQQQFVRGSLQKFVPDSENCENYGPSLFTAEDVHKIGVLDLRILNCDRHTGNMLVTSPGSTSRKAHLIPIDHALSFPAVGLDALETMALETEVVSTENSLMNHLTVANVSFDWMLFPQAKQPFSEELLEGIKSIDIVKDLKTMELLNMTVEQRLAVFLSTMVLKKGALEYGKTLHELGAMIQRTGDRSKASVLERLAGEALVGVEKAGLKVGEEASIQLFCQQFVTVLERYFKV